MNYTKTQIKRTAQAAVYSYTGVKPTLSQITLLEAADDRTYIRFRIGVVEYRFSSYICDRYFDLENKLIECVWVGDGSLTRLGRWDGKKLIKN